MKKGNPKEGLPFLIGLYKAISRYLSEIITQMFAEGF